MSDYDPQRIEAKWQKVWEEQEAFRAVDNDASREKYYLLEMLPYPSGTLHMGHMRNYTIGDAVARYKRMCGFNVLHPIGWDAFGLPAENAAIKRGVAPREWTNANIAQMKAVCKRFGFSYDWRREISTCEPEYYRWNQWFFLRMLERGLAYRKRSRVNWCPQCQTVLANEQVIDGFCWQHDTTPVESKEIEQWFLRITKYADALLDSMGELADGWPERVLVMQQNWIGKSRGTRVRFDVADVDGLALEVFTTRVDTIYGVSAVVIAARHPDVEKLLDGVRGRAAMETQLKAMQGKSVKAADIATAEKEGFFTGRFAVNPFSGERVPIWVANFVLAEYGTGAVMAVPAHDQRDFEFAEKYHLPVKIVIQPVAGPPLRPDRMNEAYTEYGRLVDSGPYTGLTSEQAHRKDGGGCRGQRIRQGRDHVPAEGLGHFTPALLGHADPGRLLQEGRNRGRAGRSAPGAAAGKCDADGTRAIATGERAGIREHDVPEMRRPGASARRTRWIRSSIRRGISTATPTRTTITRRSTRRRQRTGSRSISISAAWSTRSCI